MTPAYAVPSSSRPVHASVAVLTGTLSPARRRPLRQRRTEPLPSSPLAAVSPRLPPPVDMLVPVPVPLAPVVYPIAFVGERASGVLALLGAIVGARLDYTLAAPVHFDVAGVSFAARCFTRAADALSASVRRAAVIVAVFDVRDVATWIALLGDWRTVLLARRRHPPTERPMLVLVANDTLAVADGGTDAVGHAPARVPAVVSQRDAESTARAYTVDVHVATNASQPRSAKALAAIVAAVLASNVDRYASMAIHL